MDTDAAQQAAQQAANCLLNETISNLPKVYGTAKDTVTAENLINHINASVHALAWTPGMAYDYSRMALHSSAENWIKLVQETDEEFQPLWDYIKLQFKEHFGKKMDVAKVGSVLDNLKMDPNEPFMEFAAKMNTNFSQLQELIPMGQIANIPAQPTDRTNAVCEGIHDNAIRHPTCKTSSIFSSLDYLKQWGMSGYARTSKN